MQAKSLARFGVTLLVVTGVLAACGPVPMARMGGNVLSFSFVGASAPRSVGARSNQIEALTDDRFYKEPLGAANRGNRVGTFTASDFILDIDYQKVYVREEQGFHTEDLQSQVIQPYPNRGSGGALIPQHVNLVYAKHFIRNAAVTRDLWDGFTMQFLPHALSTSADGFYVMSIVAVDLGSAYAGVELPGEITQQLRGANPTLHYFSVQYLQPYATDSLGHITIGADVTQAGIQDPGGNGAQVFFPGPSIDLSGFIKPEFVLFWNMKDLIEVYDNSTTRKDDTLQWISPTDEDFDKVVVRRKAGSAPTSHADGTKVYEGCTPNYADSTGTSGTHYYYLVYTVDFQGNESTGIVLDQVQH